MTRDETDPDGVLTPDDLELDDEEVRKLEDDRYVIDTSDDGGERRDRPRERPAVDPSPGRSQDPSPPDLSAVPETYAIDLTIKTERGVERFEHRSDDVREQFEALLYWYARRLDAERPPEEVLQVLFDATDLP